VTTRLTTALSSAGGLFLAGLGIAVVVGLLVGGGAAPLLIVDPGPAVRWGIPIAKALVHLGAALSIGSLMVAAFVLTRTQKAFGSALLVASIGAALLTVASAATAFLTFMAIYVEPVSIDQRFGDLLWLYLQSTEIGRGWLTTMGLGAVVTVLTVVVRSFGGILVAGVLSVAALWPLAEQGHAAGSANHEAAVSASFAHSVFAAMWIGGLIMMAVVAWSEKPRAAEYHAMLGRYSSIALLSFIVVALSGTTNAWLRVGSIEGLATGYGALVIAKTCALVVLGLMGAVYRRKLLGDLKASRSGVVRVTTLVVSAELALMGIASGLASALARTQTPVPQIPASEIAQATPAEILTGEPLPPEFALVAIVHPVATGLVVGDYCRVWDCVLRVGTPAFSEAGRPLAGIPHRSLGVWNASPGFRDQFGPDCLWKVPLQHSHAGPHVAQHGRSPVAGLRRTHHASLPSYRGEKGRLERRARVVIGGRSFEVFGRDRPPAGCCCDLWCLANRLLLLPAL